MTNSLKVAFCALIMASTVSTGFAQDNTSLLEQAQSRAAEILKSAQSGVKFAAYKAADYGEQGANWCRDSVKANYQAASDKVGRLYGSVADTSTTIYGSAKESVGNAYAASADKAGELYATAALKAEVAKAALTDNATQALAWVQNKTPESVKAFISNHPYVSLSAVIIPVSLFIGYKWGASQKKLQDTNEDQEQQ